MSLLDLFIGITVAILAFFGFGSVLGFTRKHEGLRGYLEQILVTVYMSIFMASATVFIVGELGLIGLGGSRGGAWGIYVVPAQPGDRAMIAFSLSIVFIVMLVTRSVAVWLIRRNGEKREDRIEDVDPQGIEQASILSVVVPEIGENGFENVSGGKGESGKPDNIRMEGNLNKKGADGSVVDVTDGVKNQPDS